MTRWALVTGPSKGIGESISIDLARRGWNLLLTARSETLLLDMQKQLSAQYNVEVKGEV